MLAASALIVSLPAALAVPGCMLARPQHEPEPIAGDLAPRRGVVEAAGETGLLAGQGRF